MTAIHIQLILKYLDYDPGELDGIVGRATQAAVREFQSAEGLTADGVVGPRTEAAMKAAVLQDRFRQETAPTVAPSSGNFWDEIRYFTREDFRCQCGGKYCNGFHAEPQERLVRLCDAIRAKLGKPCEIRRLGGSGLRCPTWNTIQKGAANSLHTKGMAADLHCLTATPAELKAAAEAVMGNTGGLGLYSWGIHVDIGPYSRWSG